MVFLNTSDTSSNLKIRKMIKLSPYLIEERREVKEKGEREIYSQVNAAFQRIAKKDKKDILNEPSKEIKKKIE